MTAHLRNLFEHYRAHHEDRPLLQWFGIVGCIAFPLFYLARRAVDTPPLYDDLLLRLAAAALCLGVTLRPWWPARLRPAFFPYSYFTVFFSLSFLLSYTMLRNHGGIPGVVNMVIGAVLVIVLADWRNAIVILVAGYVLAALMHLAADPAPELLREFIFAAGGSLLLVVGGALHYQGQKRVEINRMRRVYTGLAGSIAHEMRNPLAQVRHSLDRIASALEPAAAGAGARPSDEELQQVLGAVQEGRDAVARGLQAIELTLQQLRPESADPSRVRTVSAADCVHRAVESFAYEDPRQRQRVRVEVRGDFRFRADPDAVELVLLNLLKNALYYVPVRPAMTVKLSVAAAPSAHIIVRDTGPGIEPDLMPRLFQEFSTSGKAEGTGLGLSFCRRVMRGLGGDIDCHSQPGRFTEFVLSFQVLEESDSILPPPAAVSASGLEGRTILVVDDQPLNRAIARALGADMGLQVIEAAHAQEALDLIADGTIPDAVLMDVNMPGLDGITATRRLREMPGEAGRVPVLAVTANDSPAVQAAARDAGMQGVIAKPIDPEALAQALVHMVAGDRQARVAPRAEAEPELLNHRRLADFRRLQLLDDIVPGSLDELAIHLERMETALAAGDREAAQQSLHGFVGVSGEAGALALHALARRRYAEMLEGAEPGTGWLEELRRLLAHTEESLAREYGLHPRANGQTSSHSLRV
ncbi:hybrid sensor histidine kinase/response regulator [Ramlibacter humi]|uniref:histidine kinase n=1 Tax=Ramlibacter humi TaxID=2530451 RepID=A0A4Z0CDD7_9BURK|nr:hybrid sensor histidine kinase/response regulator [Ramlibacter humi]TFZ08209.1 hybrid sensor histidine kinase/response regulator [Ramlibacter humi]